MAPVRCCTARLVLIAALLVGVLAGALLRPVPAVAQNGLIYDPLALERALFAYPLPDDVFWIDEFERSTPVFDDVVRDFQILTYPGIITYHVFASSAVAADSTPMNVGMEMPIDVFVDDMAGGSQFHNRLIDAHDVEMAGRDLVVFSDDDATSVCVQDLNVVVCGFSSYSWTDTPDGAAVMAAVVGLALLLDAVG